jgi:uncharacterized membrane protein YfcA
LQFYLPIAELSVNIFTILGMGAAVGFLSGMFGVGGGFLMTPLLIFIGIPPPVAVGTEASQIAASSFSGVLVHLRRKSVDIKLGTVLLIGGIIGSFFGILLFRYLRDAGQLDLIIALAYVIFLGVVGSLMLVESLRAISRSRKTGASPPLRRPGQHLWIMGVGGGFIMVPAMIYLLKVPTNVVIGTSLFQILFVTAFTAVMQAATNFTVDMLLAVTLMVAGAVGAQFGAQMGQKLRGEQLRALLAVLVLGVGIRFLMTLIVQPENLYSIAGGH